ncbi:MAG: 7-cyano-7-deazaguanine synthase QueC [Eubacteriales bacterium]
MKNSLIILSGGMDSTVLLYDRLPSIALAITFKYGQKHLKEIAKAKSICDHLGVPHKIVELSLNNILKSHLLEGGGDIPEGHYEDLSMKKTVVPFRNGIMLSIAVGIAESEGLNQVLTAVHTGDHAIYPDCRPKFISNISNAAFRGTYNEVIISAPYIECSKRDIALIGKDLKVPFEATWSCYNGREKHCGKCGTCVERKEALLGFDPTIYEGD